MLKYVYKLYRNVLRSFSTTNGKPYESMGRKAKGPLKWQPVTERGVFCLQAFRRKGKPYESLGRKAKGPLKWQPATEGRVLCEEVNFIFIARLSAFVQYIKRIGRRTVG
jgi:hypothetical protein